MIDLAKYESVWLSRAGKLSRKAAAWNTNENEMRNLIMEICESMSSYAELWQPNATHLRESGVYKKISELVKPRDSYIDIGCGTGELIEAVNFPNALGIDVNHYVLAKSEKYLASKGFQVNSYGSSFLRWVPGRGIVVTPVDEGKSRILERGKANLLQDDVRDFKPNRSLELARRHIKEIGKPDYVTFTMFGGSSHATGERHVPMSMQPYMLFDTLVQVRRTASEMLPSGGYYVEASRCLRNHEMVNRGRDGFIEEFGNVFSLEDVELLELPQEKTNDRFYLFNVNDIAATTRVPADSREVILLMMKSRRR